MGYSRVEHAMTADREQRILARRLLDHFQAESSPAQRWVETADDPLDASILTAPLDTLTEAVLEQCDRYDWDTVRDEVEARLDSDVAQLTSELTRAEAATADFFIHQVHRDLHLIVMDTQEDPITPALPDEFAFDPLVHEIVTGEDDTSDL